MNPMGNVNDDVVFNKMTLRKQWCDDVAKEFFANKQMRKQYRVTLSDSHNPAYCHEEVQILSEKEFSEYKTFLNDCWQEFKKDYPEEFDDDGDYVGGSWDAYFCDSLAEERFMSHWHDSFGNPHEATVEFVDLFNPVYACPVTLVKCDSCTKFEDRSVICWVYLTMNVYTQILAEYLYGTQISITNFRERYPEVHHELTNTYGYFADIDWTLSFDTIKNDASVILSKRIKERPKLY